jgi:hypothetical protein
MGYEVHITRTRDWGDSESRPISLGEWMAYIASDPEMQPVDFAEGEDGSRYRNEGLAVWTAYSGHGVGGNMAWFDLFHGRIDVVRPDEEILAKMVEIARRLGADVVDDLDEVFWPRGTAPSDGVRQV